MNVAFLFPGQGSQVPDMPHTLPDHPTISPTLGEVSETLKQNVLPLDEVKLPENLQSVFARKFRRKRFYLNIRSSGSKAGLAPPSSWLSLRGSDFYAKRAYEGGLTKNCFGLTRY